jgi:hypothetical protein
MFCPFFSAALRLNKSLAFLRVEPLHGAARHRQSLPLTVEVSFFWNRDDNVTMRLFWRQITSRI